MATTRPYRSQVLDWDDQTGVGYLTTGEDYFTVASKDFTRFHRHPREGDHVLHSVGYTPDNKVVVTDAVLLRARGFLHDLAKMWPSLFLVLPLLSMLVAPGPISFGLMAAWMLVASVAAFLLFHCEEFLRQGIGKVQPDSMMHFLEMVGGWPGSIAAQRRLHLKESDLRYQVFFWISVGLWQALSLDGVLDWSGTQRLWSSVSPAIERLMFLS